MSEKILQIMPAGGFEVEVTQEDGFVYVEDVVAWALLEAGDGYRSVEAMIHIEGGFIDLVDGVSGDKLIRRRVSG